MNNTVKFGLGFLAMSTIIGTQIISIPIAAAVTFGGISIGTFICGLGFTDTIKKEVLKSIDIKGLEVLEAYETDWGNDYIIRIPLDEKNIEPYEKILQDKLNRAVRITKQFKGGNSQIINVKVYNHGYVYDNLPEVERGIQDIMGTINTSYKDLSYNIRVASKTDTDYGYVLKIPTTPGFSLVEYENKKKALEEFLKGSVTISSTLGEIVLDVTSNELKTYYPFEIIKTEHPCEIVLGYIAKGLKQFQLKQNMLIAGTAGYGKSTLLRGILTQLINNSNKSELALNLVDFKRTELGLFKHAEQVTTFCTSVDEFKESLQRLGKESLRRYALFEREGVLDIEKYNASRFKKLPYIITIIDEIAQLEGNAQVMSTLQKRLSFDRASGIFYILCTQRPSANILSGDVKANIDIRVSFKTVDSTNSWIVLDKKNTAEYITVKGRGLLKMDGELTEFQAMYLDEKDVLELIKTKEVQSDKRTG